MPTAFARSSRSIVLAALVLLMLLGQAGCETTLMMRQKGYDALRAGDYVEARHQFGRAVEKSPQDYLSQYYLGVTYLELGEPLKAQLALERALTLRPQGSARTGDILDKLALAMYQQGRYDSLHAFLARSASYYGRTQDYLRQARYLAKTGDLDSAKVAYRKAAYFADKGDARPYLAIAEFYSSFNDVPSAIEALRYGYYVDPTNERIADGLRKYGIVPGPTVAVEPPKPALMR